jgi:hypothetical protein
MNETGDARSAPAAALDRSALPSPYIQWGPTFGGGLVAAAVFFVLISFATAIGLAVSSVSPSWRDTSVGLVVLSGVWVVLTEKEKAAKVAATRITTWTVFLAPALICFRAILALCFDPG